MRALLTLSMLTIAVAAGTPALAGDDGVSLTVPLPQQQPVAVPAPRGNGTLANAMAYVRTGRWDAARAEIDAMRDSRLAAFARAELYLAANSPRVDGDALRDLLTQAPDLPQAQRLAGLAQRRGVAGLPAVPSTQSLGWAGASPRRGNPRMVSDSAAVAVRQAIQQRITADDPAGAESLFASSASAISLDAQTELRARVAWAYYIENDDASARRIAGMAQSGSGSWLAQADWTQGLASWRLNDCRAAMTAFRAVTLHSDDPEMTAGGNYWLARASMACGVPRDAQPALRRAAALTETFYGQLAIEALGVTLARPRLADDAAADRRIASITNVQTATALAGAGELDLADQTLRHQARIGGAQDHEALIRLAGRLGMAETQFFLAHNAPRGVRPAMAARFPAPAWAPSDGWRVNPALIFAHALQESQFRPRVVSPAGAVGLMQVRPGTGNDMGLRQMGGDLTNPAVNLALGQSYIEYLRDGGVTGGQLPKVIAAYNAGLVPVTRWNSEIRDNGDPLLYIESIPYWETRGYVGTVLRNLWIYEAEMGTRSGVRADLVQHHWPRVPAAPASARQASMAPMAGRGGR